MARMALALIGLLTCGCDDGGGAVLFSDDFAGSFPAPNWVGEGKLDTASGAPAPSLHLATTPPLALASLQMSNPIQVGTGLIFRFSAAVPAGSSGRLFLNDAQAAGDPLGYINFRGIGDVEYVINGLTGAIQPLGQHDGQFHEFELQYTKDGASSWSRDGAIQLQGKAVNPATLTRLLIQTGTVAGFTLDQVEIESR